MGRFQPLRPRGPVARLVEGEPAGLARHGQFKFGRLRCVSGKHLDLDDLVGDEPSRPSVEKRWAAAKDASQDHHKQKVAPMRTQEVFPKHPPHGAVTAVRLPGIQRRLIDQLPE